MDCFAASILIRLNAYDGFQPKSVPARTLYTGSMKWNSSQTTFGGNFHDNPLQLKPRLNSSIIPPVTESPRHTPGAHQWDATHYEVRRIHSCPGEPWPCKWFETLQVVGFFVGITKCGAWMVGISTNGSLVRTGLMVEPVLGRSPVPYKLNFWGLGAQTKDIMIDCGISGVIVGVYLSIHFFTYSIDLLLYLSMLSIYRMYV